MYKQLCSGLMAALLHEPTKQGRGLTSNSKQQVPGQGRKSLLLLLLLLVLLLLLLLLLTLLLLLRFNAATAV